LLQNVERFDRSQTIPAASQRHDAGVIRISFRDGAFQGLGPRQIIGGIFNARRPRGRAAKGVGGAPGTEFKRFASGGKQRRYFFQEFAAVRRKNPGGNFRNSLGSVVVFGDETLQLIFEVGIGGSRVGFSDNLSELLSPFRFARAVSARF